MVCIIFLFMPHQHLNRELKMSFKNFKTYSMLVFFILVPIVIFAQVYGNNSLRVETDGSDVYLNFCDSNSTSNGYGISTMSGTITVKNQSGSWNNVVGQTNDKIYQLDTDLECTDSGDGYVTILEDNAEIIRITGSRIGINTSSPSAKLHADQDDPNGSKYTLVLKQTDVDQDMVKFIGTSATDADDTLVDVSDLATPGSIIGWISVFVQDDAVSGAISDSTYYIPFYSAPTGASCPTVLLENQNISTQYTNSRALGNVFSFGSNTNICGVIFKISQGNAQNGDTITYELLQHPDKTTPLRSTTRIVGTDTLNSKWTFNNYECQSGTYYYLAIENTTADREVRADFGPKGDFVDNAGYRSLNGLIDSMTVITGSNCWNMIIYGP